MELARIGIINRTINMLDFMLADASGVYEKHGLTVQFDLLGGLRSIEALRGGELDVVVSIGAAVRAIMQDQTPVRVVLLVHRNGPHWVMGKPGVTDALALKGGSVQAGDRGTEPDLMVRKWLRASGLEPDVDVELTYEKAHVGWTDDGPEPAETAAIARTLEREVLEAKGYASLVELASTFPNTLIHGLVVMRSTIEVRPAMIDRLIAAHRDVSAMIDEASPEALSFIKQTWGVDDGRARSAAASLNGVFVARQDVADFGAVIASSAEALGMPPIDVADLVTFA